MKRLTTGTYALIADGKKALITRNTGTAFEPKLEVLHREQIDNPANTAQGRDQPGRRTDGGPGQRSAMEASDRHQLAEDRFAASLVERLARMAQADEFERLVVAAPPRTLAALREAMDQRLASLVVAELDKDLTGMTLDKIAERLRADLEALDG